MTQSLKNFFCLMLLFCSLTFQASQIFQTLNKIGKSQPTALVGSFFIFFAAAVPQFAMAAYQNSTHNTIDTEGKSSIVQSLFPFILRLDERGYTINPTMISSKEYFSTGLALSATSLFYLVTGGILTKIEETFEWTPPSSTDSNLIFGRAILDQLTTGESYAFNGV